MRRYVYGWLLLGAALALWAGAWQPVLSIHKQDTLTPQGFLPLAGRPLLATILFGTSTDAQGRPTPPQTTIGPDARKLFYYEQIMGAAGQSFRVEYLLPSGPLTPDQGSVPTNDFVQSGVMCYTDPSIGGCDAPTGTLMPGDYTIRVIVDEHLIAESSVTVLSDPNQSGSLQHGVPRITH